MSSPHTRLPGRCEAAFTLVEVSVVAAILVLLSAVSFPSMVRFYEEQKLRQAAIELQTWLLRSRTLTQRRFGPCAIQAGPRTATLAANDTFTTTATNLSGQTSPSVCTSTTLPLLDLQALTGVRGLCLSNDGSSFASCTRPAAIVFNELGVLTGTPQALYLSGTATGGTQYCVELALSLVRVGFRNGNSGACTYSRS